MIVKCVFLAWGATTVVAFSLPPHATRRIASTSRAWLRDTPSQGNVPLLAQLNMISTETAAATNVQDKENNMPALSKQGIYMIENEAEHE